MYHDEYHLHDKDRNAIRSEGRGKSVRVPAAAKKSASAPAGQEPAVILLPASPEQQAVIVKKAPRVIVDQGYSAPVEAGFVLMFYDFLLLGVAGLLLLAMLVLRRKRENRASYPRLHSK